MIDIKKLRETPEVYKTACQQKDCDVDVDELLGEMVD